MTLRRSPFWIPKVQGGLLEPLNLSGKRTEYNAGMRKHILLYFPGVLPGTFLFLGKNEKRRYRKHVAIHHQLGD